ncbi:hypothetical protein B0A48_09243 [Cryoendolithus antarcticus]|uniref:C2H2-type domain-containing protein n=1 Tax=Cryoendolithus antarcticus TaxID=1507870 RepID=A0A1V8T2E8_9PEZI|nr:hypothetical protein B0A48_09243 [Cryoendolithus antarcticus]
MNPHCDRTAGLCNSPEHWNSITFQDGPNIDPVLDFDFNEALSGMEFTFPGYYDVGDITGPSVIGFAIDTTAFAALPFEPRPGHMEILPSAINAQDIASQQGFLWNPSPVSSQASVPRFVPRPSRSTLCPAADSRIRSSLFDYNRATTPTRASTDHTTTLKRPAPCIDQSYGTASAPVWELQSSSNGQVNDAPGLALWLDPTSAVSRPMLPPLDYGTPTEPNTEGLAAEDSEQPRKRQKENPRTHQCKQCDDCFERQCELTKHFKYKHLPGKHVNVFGLDLFAYCITGTNGKEKRERPIVTTLNQSMVFAHLDASAMDFSSKGVTPKAPGLLVAMKTFMQQVEQQVLRDYGRSTTTASTVWNIKGGDIAVLAAVVGLRWMRMSHVRSHFRFKVRAEGLNSRHPAWSKTSGGRVVDER